MEPLHTRKCVPCEGGVAPFTPEQIKDYLSELSGWNVVDNKKIEKNYRFVDFKRAIGFVNEVADEAEFENHHPDINLHNWNQVTISLSTHAIKGLSENDFIMAAKIDQILEETKE